MFLTKVLYMDIHIRNIKIGKTKEKCTPAGTMPKQT